MHSVYKSDLSDSLLKFNVDKMHFFFVCVLCTMAMVPLHFLSVEHLKLQEKHGKDRGTKIGEVYGLISGYGFFLSWMGIWVSPQPRFAVQIATNLSVQLPVFNLSIPVFHLGLCTPFLAIGAWIAVNGVKEVTLRVAETHRSQRVVTTGVYSIVRHPQHLGALLAHLGISILFSAWYSLLFTPLMVALIVLISIKEEEELVREFGDEYESYRKKVPMLIPRLKS